MAEKVKRSWLGKLAVLIAALAMVLVMIPAAPAHAANNIESAAPGETVYLVKSWENEHVTQDTVTMQVNGTYQAILAQNTVQPEENITKTDSGVTYLFADGTAAQQSDGTWLYKYNVSFIAEVSKSDVVNGIPFVKTLHLPSVLEGDTEKITVDGTERTRGVYNSLTVTSELNSGNAYEALNEELSLSGQYFGIQNYSVTSQDLQNQNVTYKFVMKVWKNDLTPEEIKIEILQNGAHFGYVTIPLEDRFGVDSYISASELRQYLIEAGSTDDEVSSAYKTLGIAENDQFTGITVQHLPKYDANGNEYTYTFREAEGSGYVSTVNVISGTNTDLDGTFVIANVSKETPKTEEAAEPSVPAVKTGVKKTVKSPKTGDESTALLWTVVLGASAAMLTGAAAKRRAREER